MQSVGAKQCCRCGAILCAHHSDLGEGSLCQTCEHAYKVYRRRRLCRHIFLSLGGVAVVAGCLELGLTLLGLELGFWITLCCVAPAGVLFLVPATLLKLDDMAPDLYLTGQTPQVPAAHVVSDGLED